MGACTRRWSYLGLLGAVLLLLAVPLCVARIPPVVDYPNHLARMVVLARGAGDPFLSQVYAVQWDAIPNVGIDVVMPPLLTILPVYAAGRLMLALTVLLPVLGTLAYSRAVLGMRSCWPLASGLVAYNVTFIFGFMNFLISVGLALLAAAAWARWRDRHPMVVTAAFMPLMAAVFFAHMLGAVFLGLLIASHEAVALFAAWRTRRLRLAGVAARLLPCALVALPTVLLLVRSFAGTFTGGTAWVSWRETAFGLAAPFLTYAWPLDIAAGLLVVAIIALCLAFRRARVAPEAALAAGVLLVAYFCVPYILDGSHLAIRLPVMLGFLLFAGFAPRDLGPRLGPALGVVLALVFAGRIALIASVWSGQDGDIAALRAVLADLPAGSRVLATSLHRADNPAYWNAMPRRRFVLESLPTTTHLPALVLIEHDSIWPVLFTRPGRQPIVVREGWHDIADGGTGDLPDYHVLATDVPDPVETAKAPYLAGWPAKFDYVLVMLAGGAPDLDAVRPDRLTLVARNDTAALFRVGGVPPPRPAGR